MHTYLSNARYFRLGRHALSSALNVLQIKPGDNVLVPALICKDLMAPVNEMGAIPIFYGVGQDMGPMDLQEGENIRAVLAVNYFGFPQDLTPFRKYCEKNRAALIEDNAHGFLSNDEAGIPLGTRGDLGIFSIRKTFALPDGAMLMANNTEYEKRLENQLPFCDGALPLAFKVKRRLSWLQQKSGFMLLPVGQDLVRRFRYWRTGYAIAPSSPEIEFEMPGNSAPHSYSMSALPKLNFSNEISRRRCLYNKFYGQLAGLGIQPVFGELPDGAAPYGYPFYADNQAAQEVVKIARKQGLDCYRWPDLPAVIAATAPLHYLKLWMVSFKC